MFIQFTWVVFDYSMSKHVQFWIGNKWKGCCSYGVGTIEAGIPSTAGVRHFFLVYKLLFLVKLLNEFATWIWLHTCRKLDNDVKQAKFISGSEDKSTFQDKDGKLKGLLKKTYFSQWINPLGSQSYGSEGGPHHEYAQNITKKSSNTTMDFARFVDFLCLWGFFPFKFTVPVKILKPITVTVCRNNRKLSFNLQI